MFDFCTESVGNGRRPDRLLCPTSEFVRTCAKIESHHVHASTMSFHKNTFSEPPISTAVFAIRNRLPGHRESTLRRNIGIGLTTECRQRFRAAALWKVSSNLNFVSGQWPLHAFSSLFSFKTGCSIESFKTKRRRRIVDLERPVPQKTPWPLQRQAAAVGRGPVAADLETPYLETLYYDRRLDALRRSVSRPTG